MVPFLIWPSDQLLLGLHHQEMDAVLNDIMFFSSWVGRERSEEGRGLLWQAIRVLHMVVADGFVVNSYFAY